MSRKKTDYQRIGQKLESYCKKYSLPLEYFFEIINEQKVVPMLRGKGMEYNAFLKISDVLNTNEWTVHKLNPNPQQKNPDKDISIIHRRSNITLSVESKSAVRGSMTAGLRAKLFKGITHFKVKCHRSRSNVKLVGTSNDRYKADAFDIIITTPANALFKGGTISDTLEMLEDETLLANLRDYYGVSTSEQLLKATDNDWRFVLPSKIADKNGFIPRTPYVQLLNDPNWLSLDQFQATLEEVVRQKWQARNKPSRN